MKNYFLFFFLLLFSTILISNYALTKQETEIMGGPQYIISVTHDGENLGDIIIETFPDEATENCRNFDSLVSIGFYDGTAFHRVVEDFVIQGGDPNSKSKPKETWGRGDPSQRTVPLEPSMIHHERGILSMARRGGDVNSATSQFFICLDKLSSLDGQYTVFGQVIEGMDVVDEIVDLPLTGESPDKKVEMKIRKKE